MSELELTADRPGPMRFTSIDVARGLIMILMALDHTSESWNHDRFSYEFGIEPQIEFSYASPGQQFTREITHFCAPGFQLLAGLGLALSVQKRKQLGVSESHISRDMVLRAAVLFGCEWLLLHWTFGGIWFFFLVLSCIGASMLLFAGLRFLPRAVIGLGSLAILLASPLYCPQYNVLPTMKGYLVHIWTNISLGASADGAAWWVMYPILPWLGFFGIGWWLADVYVRNPKPLQRRLITMGTIFIVLGVLLRWFGGDYGDRCPGGSLGPTSAGFWVLSKYPPTPAFAFLTLGPLLVMLGLLRSLDHSDRAKRLVRVPLVFGQVALFFYLIHFHLYAAYPYLTKTMKQYDLATTYMVWLGGLIILWPICLLYGQLRKRYNRVLRYL